MQSEPTLFATLFWRGEHQSLLNYSHDLPGFVHLPQDLGYVVAALAFLGRTIEAEHFLASRLSEMSAHQACLARFSLAVADCRAAQYSRARHLFVKNWLQYCKNPEPEARFFAAQGLAFYRFFCGRYALAEQHARRALQRAVEGHFVYGKALAADLLGHTAVRRGEVSRGLLLLKEALRFANILGSGGFAHTLLASIALYKARHQIDKLNSIAELNSLLEQPQFENTYTLADLHLELARVHALGGQTSIAFEHLNEAARLNYAFGNRRQEIAVQLKFAHLHFLTGNLSKSKSHIALARKLISPEVDLCLDRSCLGMEIQFGFNNSPEAASRLKQLTFLTGEQIALRMLERQSYSPAEIARVGDDALGDLMDECSLPSSNQVGFALAARYGWAKFLRDQAGIAQNARALVLNLVPGKLVAFSNGDVLVSEQNVTPHLQSLLQALAFGNQTHQEIVKSIWNYDYHPLKHDPLLYRLVSRLRELLQQNAYWIQAVDNCYRLADGVQILINGKSQETSVELPKFEVSVGSHLRQQKLISFFKRESSLQVSKYCQLFEVSRATATRDLTKLVAANILVSNGKGRATSYTLKSEGEHT